MNAIFRKGRLLVAGATRLALLAALLASAVPPPVLAAGGASVWSDDHASRARLIDGGADGAARLAGIEIELASEHHTYWRHAGDSGLPPGIDWSASSNVAAVELLFPAPLRFEDAAGASFGYADGVVLPLRVTPADPAAPVDLRIMLEYGVCKEICIPARADMALSLDPRRAEPHSAVGEALARVPRAVALGAAGPLSILAVEVAGPDRLAVRARAPEGATLFVEGPDYRWFLDPRPAMTPAGPGEGVFAVEVADKPRDARDPAALRFTLVAPGVAIETTHTVDPAALAAGR